MKKNESIIKDYIESFTIAKEYNKEIEPLINKSHEILNPLKVLNLFKNIPDEVNLHIFLLIIIEIINFLINLEPI